MKQAIALTLALGMTFTGAAGTMADDAPSAPEPLKITEQRYNPAICRKQVVKYFENVKAAAQALDAEKLLKPGIKERQPEVYENAMRDGDVFHMAAHGIDRYADFEASMINLQNQVAPGSAQDRAAGERFFCDSLLGYSSAIAAGVSIQIPVEPPSFENSGADAPDPSAPTRISFERMNVRACPAPVLQKFREVTGKQIPNPHPMVDEENMSPDMAAAYNGAQIRTGMIRAAQAGMVFAMTEYADAMKERFNLDETQTRDVFCDGVKLGTESLEYFMEKNMRYSEPKKSAPVVPGGPTMEM